MGWYYKLPIKVKLLLSFSALIVMTLFIAVSAVVSMKQSQDVASYVHWTLEERYQRIERVSEAGRKLQNMIFVYASNGDFGSETISHATVSDAANDFRRYANALVPGNFPNEIREIKAGANQVLDILEKKSPHLLSKVTLLRLLHLMLATSFLFMAPCSLSLIM